MTDPSEPLLENEQKKFSFNLVFAVIVTLVGSSFQFGYNSGVINAPQLFIEQFINQTYEDRHLMHIDESEVKLLYGVMVSIFAFGGMIGSFLAGYFADFLGRKKAMLLNNIFVFIAIALMTSAKVAHLYEFLIVGRLIIGFNSGINTGLAPLYLTEIAPKHLRGTLGVTNQMGIVISILISQIFGIPVIFGTKNLWPYLFVIPGIFALFQLILLPFCPETPAYLLKSDRSDAAKQSLIWLRANDQVGNELEEIRNRIETVSSSSKIPIKSLFLEKSLFKPLLIAIVLQCAQQLTGINAIFYYSTQLFMQAGVGSAYSVYVTVAVGLVSVITCIISAVLVDKFGRRILMLTGLGGMFINSAILTFALVFLHRASWLSIVSVVLVILFVVFFQIGPGSIPWFITAELFMDNARASAISVAGLVNWTGNFVIGLSYPPLENAIGGYTFAIFSIIAALCWLFTFLKVPETKDRPIQEISRLFNN